MEPELRDRLDSLHQELSRTRSADPQSREMLKALLGDITRLLGRESTSSVEDQGSLAERLDGLAVQFDAEHPALSNALRKVVDVLAKAGI